MATIITHGVVALTAAKLTQPDDRHQRIATWAVALSIIPDLDVLGFPLGIAYGDFLGHRGFSHSLLFALLAAALVMATRFRGPSWDGRRWGLFALFFFATASHGLLDALTNGGLGVAFFSPFDLTRYFLPWTPLPVSPIGRGFFSEEGLEVLASEALWLGLPCLALFVACHWLRTIPSRR